MPYFGPGYFNGGLFSTGRNRLVDSGGTPHAVWSFQKLDSDYTGPCCRVRRDSDDAELDIGFAGEVVDIAAAVAFASPGLPYLDTIYDQSGNARDLVQATGANQPYLAMSDFNFPCMRIIQAGGSHSLTSAFGLAQPYTRVVVARRTADISSSVQVLSGGADWSASFATTPNTGYFQINAGLNVDTTTVVPQIPFSAILVYDGASSKIYKENVEIGTGNAGTGAIVTPYEVGAWAGGQEGGEFEWFEEIIYSSSISANERTRINKSQVDRYDIHVPTIYDYWGGDHWFKVIPSYATYRTFQGTGNATTGFVEEEEFDYDFGYTERTDNSDPVVTLKVPGSFSDRDSGETVQGSVHLRSDFVLPDAIVDVSTPNNPMILINEDTWKGDFFNAACRPTEGGDLWGYQSTPPRTHGGSGLIGGEILQAELTAGVINHAIAVNVDASRYLNATAGGFVDPATKADTGFDDPESTEYYGATDGILFMGSRVAIPRDVTAASLGLTEPDAITVFNAFKRHGGIIVDNTSYPSFALNTDPAAGASLLLVEEQLITIKEALVEVNW